MRPTVTCTVHLIGTGCYKYINYTFTPQLSFIAKVPQFFQNFKILSFTMALGAHMRPYSYMYCAPHRDGVLHPELCSVLSIVIVFWLEVEFHSSKLSDSKSWVK